MRSIEVSDEAAEELDRLAVECAMPRWRLASQAVLDFAASGYRPEPPTTLAELRAEIRGLTRRPVKLVSLGAAQQESEADPQLCGRTRTGFDPEDSPETIALAGAGHWVLVPGAEYLIVAGGGQVREVVAADPDAWRRSETPGRWHVSQPTLLNADAWCRRNLATGELSELTDLDKELIALRGRRIAAGGRNPITNLAP